MGAVVPGVQTFARTMCLRELLERRLAHEVMVEVDQEAPVHVIWRHEPALEVVADASAQPAVLEVRGHGAFILNEIGQAGIGLIPGKRIVNVDVRETALGMVHAIGFPAQLLETKALPDLPDLLVNRITIFGRPMDFVAKRARHAEPDEPDVLACDLDHARARSEEHTSELQSLMRISY